MWNVISRFSKERLKQLLPSCNCDFEALFTQDTIPASGSRTYRLPLFGTFWDQVSPHMRSGIKDIEIRFQCASGIKVSGSGIPSLTSMNLIFEETQEHDGSLTHARHVADHQAQTHITNFLEFTHVSQAGTLIINCKSTNQDLA